MKIAIIAPSHKPFMMGGAEKLWMGLLTGFNRFTPNPCELFKFPVDEFSFWNLVDAYKYFYELDLSGFDMVISGKYPAWMCQHPNHLVYMLHPLRGLYDQYGSQPTSLWGITSQQSNQVQYSPSVKYIWNLLGDSSTTIEDIFDALDYLRMTERPDAPLFSFPGPLIRRVLHALDIRAMRKARRIMAIANTVARRQSYFPVNAAVEVLYPPTILQNLTDSAREYFFTASRLDYAKRLDMLIRAYLMAEVSIPLKIAGTGPHLKNLQEIAHNDPRIEFVGFVSDVQLEELYSRAYAVPFVPMQEDYGLITIEAMHCSKAVITCTDSGGSTEFVTPETGYLCDPTLESLAKGFRDAAAHPEETKMRGLRARQKVADITWEKTVQHISSVMYAPENTSPPRKKLLALSTYGIFPPQGGGQNRIYYLYQELSKKFDIEMLALSYLDIPRREIYPHVWETCVARTPEWRRIEEQLNKTVGTASGDIVFLEHMETVPAFVELAQKLSKDADAVLMEHPYCYPLMKLLNKPFILSSHNVEWLLKKAMYTENAETARLITLLRDTEKEAYHNALVTVFCCETDANTFQTDFGNAQHFVVNNGYDTQSIRFIPQSERVQLRLTAGYDKPIVLFMGSWHKPNIESVEYILGLAPQLPEWQFIVVGSVGDYFKDCQLPYNVMLTGSIDDKTKMHYLSIATVAVNPMFSGSGTNLKMLDFMGSGIPVVSTPIGARGHIIDDNIYLCREIEEFLTAIHDAQKMDTTFAERYARTFFSWSSLGKKYTENLDIALSCNVVPQSAFDDEETYPQLYQTKSTKSSLYLIKNNIISRLKKLVPSNIKKIISTYRKNCFMRRS